MANKYGNCPTCGTLCELHNNGVVIPFDVHFLKKNMEEETNMLDLQLVIYKEYIDKTIKDYTATQLFFLYFRKLQQEQVAERERLNEISSINYSKQLRIVNLNLDKLFFDDHENK